MRTDECNANKSPFPLVMRNYYGGATNHCHDMPDVAKCIPTILGVTLRSSLCGRLTTALTMCHISSEM